MKRSILLIDDDASLRRVTEFNLQEAGYSVITAEDGQQGLELFQRERPRMVITDVRMPGIDGYRLLDEVLALEAQTLVIIITAFSTVEQAVEAIKQGAYDYLAKPFSRDQLTHTVERAFEYSRLRQENVQLKDELSADRLQRQLIGEAPAMKRLLERLNKVAASQATVLITGESGTGKEVVARALHQGSSRREQPFVTVNCAAIPKDLMESELFGHVKGSFTGAVRDRRGKFALAHGGTLFLDEIGELSPELQPKLLRVLQEQQIEPVGGVPEDVDVRVLAATNRDLEEQMARGAFREDLYYRLAVVPLEIPPLRERKEDIPLLLQHCMARHHADEEVSLADDARRLLQEYSWPGNVRELENVVEQILILRSSNHLAAGDLPERIARPGKRLSGVLNLPDEGYSLEQLEQDAVLEALRRSNGNKSRAAAFLQIPRHTLLYRLEKYQIRDYS